MVKSSATVACSLVLAFIVSAHAALSPVPVDRFMSSIDMSSDVRISTWSGRGDLCMKKAMDTGYPMLWVLYATDPSNGKEPLETVRAFLGNDLCRQKFCDLVNGYKYIILCCEDYGDAAARERKNAVYGYPEPHMILNESTGSYERNHCGYPVKIGTDHYCDHVPSIQLLKFDSSANVLFHICADASAKMVYDEKFSPYASKFPIVPYMCTGTDAKDSFAAWLKQYLDLYPVAKQIDAYGSYGSANGYGLRYGVKEMAVTETEDPTEYQISLHRGNLMFRAVTSMDDMLIKRKIGYEFSALDDGVLARGGSGMWFVNHDCTVSAVVSEISTGTKLEIVPVADCILDARQRSGVGFSLSGRFISVITNVYYGYATGEKGDMIGISITNVETVASSAPFLHMTCERGELVSVPVATNALYEISTYGNSIFDVISTRSR